MTDPNLVRVLQSQVKRRVGLVDYAAVSQGAGKIARHFAALRGESYGFAIVDALSDNDLVEIGAACADLPLVTAGSGLAVGLPENFRRKGMLAKDVVADALPGTGGLRAVVAGSCSIATQRQVALRNSPVRPLNQDQIEELKSVFKLDFLSTLIKGR
jgi:uncharacterized protein YgbK (DUF1537 family)